MEASSISQVGDNLSSFVTHLPPEQGPMRPCPESVLLSGAFQKNCSFTSPPAEFSSLEAVQESNLHFWAEAIRSFLVISFQSLSRPVIYPLLFLLLPEVKAYLEISLSQHTFMDSPVPNNTSHTHKQV